jgi:sterol desaturase/sphingolipid hydroxylase (fatty acid hydroxylase superfamily)
MSLPTDPDHRNDAAPTGSCPEPSFGTRNKRGEWRPPYPVKYAPLFVWPLRPLKALKWVLSFPGFLWPWNSIWLGISLLTWFYLQPELSRCAEFRFDWIARMFLRNMVLLWIVSGGWHLILYTLKLQGTEQKYDPRWQAKNDKNFLFKNQVWDNIFWSCAFGCPIWTAYEALLMWGYANGKLPYADWATHPVYFCVWLCLIPFWREFHFYWIHRLIHWRPLYKAVHYLHHKNINPGPWSGLAMHPVEHLLYFSVLLIHLVVPSHPIHMLFNAQHTALTPAGGHHGFEGPVLKGKVPTGSYFHYLHHRYIKINFGENTLPLDKWFGTFMNGLPKDAAGKPKKDTNKGKNPA